MKGVAEIFISSILTSIITPELDERKFLKY